MSPREDTNGPRIEPTDREAFCLALSTGPLLQCDAIALLCGEDAEPRMAVAYELLAKGGAPLLVLLGGKSELPRWMGANDCLPWFLGKGVSPSMLIADTESQHTQHQAVNLAALCRSRGWSRVLLVASSYHLPRAFLTVLQALRNARLARKVRIVAVPCPQTPWFAAPAAMRETRMALLGNEIEKMERYGAMGHCASWAEGLAYLKSWESK